MPGLDFYVRAFDFLSTERAAGQAGLMPIPWSKVIMYASMRCVDQAQAERLERYILILDAAYVNRINSRINKDGDAKAKRVR